MHPVIALTAQTILALVGLQCLSRRVLPGLCGFSQPGLVLDVWAPLALVLPMLACAASAGNSVNGVVGVVIAGPLFCGFLAMGIGLVQFAQAERGRPSSATMIGALAASAAAALLVLLLGAAHDLTLWTGQCAFAIAAVVLWLNTPEVNEPDHTNAEPDGQVSGGLALFVLCGIGQAVAVWLMPADHRAIGAGMAMLQAALVLAWTGRLAGAEACARLGAWAAAYGVLFGLGVLSLAHLLPEAVNVLIRWQRSEHTPGMRVAFGFGKLAGEAAALLAGAMLLVAAQRRPRLVRLSLGMVIIALAMAGMAWRIAAMH